jgi:Kef-type K+ transport system membrane component KefB
VPDGLRIALGLAAVVLVARLLGALARRLKQPAVAGEILAGVLLGPSLTGLVATSSAADVAARIAVGVFLLAAGMEVDLSTVRRERRTSLFVGVSGLAVPFALGFATAWFAPDLLAVGGRGDRVSGAIFFGIALSISALPVIARTLMDLGLFRTSFGMTVIAAAVLDDVVGWVLFALLVARFGGAEGNGPGPAWTLPLVLILAVVMLTVVRRGIDGALPRAAPRLGTGGVVAAALLLAGAAGLAAHWAGVHAMFGAFLAGIALGDSKHLPEKPRVVLTRSVDGFFAPLFFGSIGLKVDVAHAFDPALCALVLGLACAAKLVGCSTGARLAGMAPRRAWALGFALNSRGAMEIVLGVLALDAGLIGAPMLVALVLMALVTSVVSGPAIRHLLRGETV